MQLRAFTAPGPGELEMPSNWYTSDTQIACEPPECADGAGVHRVSSDTELVESIEIPPIGGRPGRTIENPIKLPTSTHTEWTVNVDPDAQHHPGVLLDWSIDTGLDTWCARSGPIWLP